MHELKPQHSDYDLNCSASLRPQEVKKIHPQRCRSLLPRRATSPSRSFLSKVGSSCEELREMTLQESINKIVVPAPRRPPRSVSYDTMLSDTVCSDLSDCFPARVSGGWCPTAR